MNLPGNTLKPDDLAALAFIAERAPFLFHPSVRWDDGEKEIEEV